MVEALLAAVECTGVLPLQLLDVASGNSKITILDPNDVENLDMDLLQQGVCDAVHVLFFDLVLQIGSNKDATITEMIDAGFCRATAVVVGTSKGSALVAAIRRGSASEARVAICDWMNSDLAREHTSQWISWARMREYKKKRGRPPMNSNAKQIPVSPKKKKKNIIIMQQPSMSNVAQAMADTMMTVVQWRASHIDQYNSLRDTLDCKRKEMIDLVAGLRNKSSECIQLLKKMQRLCTAERSSNTGNAVFDELSAGPLPIDDSKATVLKMFLRGEFESDRTLLDVAVQKLLQDAKSMRSHARFVLDHEVGLMDELRVTMEMFESAHRDACLLKQRVQDSIGEIDVMTQVMANMLSAQESLHESVSKEIDNRFSEIVAIESLNNLCTQKD